MREAAPGYPAHAPREPCTARHDPGRVELVWCKVPISACEEVHDEEEMMEEGYTVTRAPRVSAGTRVARVYPTTTAL